MTHNVARDALGDLYEHGWIKGDLGTEATGFCMMGAGFHAGHRILAIPRVCDSIIEEQYPDRYRQIAYVDPDSCDHTVWLVDVAQFNDHSDTTFEDVERVLEKAALRIDEAAP